MFVSLNTTLLPPLSNASTTTEFGQLQGVLGNSSLAIPWNVTAPYFNVSVWPFVSGQLNNNCPQCYPQVDEGDPYVYTYIYYCLLLLLIVVAIICIKLGIQRRNELIRRMEAQRRAARLRAANARGNSNTANNSNDNNNGAVAPKETDLPPAYEDIIPPDFMAKQSLPSSTDSNQHGTNATQSVANNIPASVSTLTLATNVSALSTISNDVELNTMTNTSTTRTNDVSSGERPQAHTIAETRINVTSSINANDNIV